MKVIYCSRWATYTAYLMAAIHVGIYESCSKLCREEITRHWKMCTVAGRQYGNIMYVGLDEGGREVYCMGCKKYDGMIRRALMGFDKIFKIEDHIHYINSEDLDRRIPYFFNFIQSHKALDTIGLRLFSIWMKRIYPRCIDRVACEKQKLKSLMVQ